MIPVEANITSSGSIQLRRMAFCKYALKSCPTTDKKIPSAGSSNVATPPKNGTLASKAPSNPNNGNSNTRID